VVIADHLLGRGGEGAGQIARQWEQGSHVDEGQVRPCVPPVYGGCQIGGRAADCAPPPVGEFNDDEGWTASRAERQKGKPLTGKGVMRIRDCDVRYEPVDNDGRV
jgi:hypothetical protein